jgi:NAD(P)-dependent dehydrogenase (short-subunit alcohol dehydrogenase family)
MNPDHVSGGLVRYLPRDYGTPVAAIEAFSRTLAGEIGPKGIRVVCLLSSGSPEAPGVQAAFDLTLRTW